MDTGLDKGQEKGTKKIDLGNRTYDLGKQTVGFT